MIRAIVTKTCRLPQSNIKTFSKYFIPAKIDEDVANLGLFHLKQDRPYNNTMRRNGITGFFAVLAVLFQGFLSVVHAGVAVNGATAALGNDYPFPLVICTGAGIVVLTQADIDGEGTNYNTNATGSCPICQAASAGDVALSGFGPAFILRPTETRYVSWNFRNITVKSTPRFVKKPARAPPLALFV